MTTTNLAWEAGSRLQSELRWTPLSASLGLGRSGRGWDREPIVRSKGVHDFPYRVVFFVQGDKLIIVAVAHTKRRPGYWRDRVTS